MDGDAPRGAPSTARAPLLASGAVPGEAALDAAAEQASGGEAAKVAADASDVGPPYSPRNELHFFFSKGLPLCMSAMLEWGAPPLVAIFFAGATPRSEALQSALGYGRVYYNCTILMILIGCGAYCWSVIPGCIGAGRSDRIPAYFRRAVVLSYMVLAPCFLLQLVAEPVMVALSVPPAVAAEAAIYCRLMALTGALLVLEVRDGAEILRARG